MWKKIISTRARFLNSWSGSWDYKPPIWKNYKTQFSTNQISKDEFEKKNSITQKDPKSKLEIKIMGIRIEIKNKLEDSYIVLIEWWN